MNKNINNISFIHLALIVLFITGCGHSGYEEKDGKIYHKWIHGGNWTKEYTLVEEADASTFVTIEHNLNIDLGKDKNHVFFDGTIIEGADPSTFKQVKEYYWKDKDNVFLLQFGNQRQIIPNAEPNSFQVINNSFWSKDKNNVFYKFDKLNGVQSSRFAAIDEEWGKDGNYYYHNNLRLDSLDYNSAEIVSDYYIKDKNHVFFQNKLVKGANPSTFVADGVGFFGHDDKNMFDREKNEGPITDQYKKRYIEKE